MTAKVECRATKSAGSAKLVQINGLAVLVVLDLAIATGYTRRLYMSETFSSLQILSFFVCQLRASCYSSSP